jgi:hypothetical protein
LSLYIHHVPGRLRIRLVSLRGKPEAAASACDNAIAIGGVLRATANHVTGSLLIHYDREQLDLAALWRALAARRVVQGPVPRIRGGPAPCRELGIEESAAGRLIELAVQAFARKLAQRSFAALIAVLA